MFPFLGIVALSAVFVCLTPLSGRTATELIKNGSFTETSASNALPQWNVNTWNSRATVSVQADQPTGYVAQIVSTSLIDRCAIEQRLTNLSLHKGTTLRLSGFYRTKDFAWGDGPQFFASVQVAPKANPATAPSIHIPLMPADKWTPFEQRVGLDRDFQVNKLVAAVAFIRCQGTLSLKQLSLQVIDAGEDLTLFSLKKTPPLLDGVLNDACWQGAQVAGGFMTLGKMEKATAGVETLSCYDQENLYIAVKLDEPNLEKLTVNPASPCSGDCVELFIDPENKGRSFFHIAVDSQGKCYTGFNDGIERTVSMEMSAKTGRSIGSWTVEMAIPFAALNAAPPRDNQRWGFNVGRERYTVSPQENSSWAATGAFHQRERFGKLAFYSRHEIAADLAYWNKSDRDPLMMRPFVSGYEIALAGAGAKRTPTLWTSDHFGANRTNKAWKGLTYPRGGAIKLAEEKYPEFYRASQGINRLLVGKANANDSLAQLRRQVYYAGANSPADTAAITGNLEKESGAIDDAMNAIYMDYGAAWDAGWNKEMLVGIDARIATLSARIATLRQQTDKALASVGQALNKVVPWKSIPLTVPAGDRMLNADGASGRFTFSGWQSVPSARQEPYVLLTAFDAGALHWPAAIPGQPAPGVYTYDYLDKMLNDTNAFFFPKAVLPLLFGLATYMMPLSPSLAEKTKTDADILLRGQDGLTAARPPDKHNSFNGVNPNNPEVKAYVKDHLKKLAAHVAPSGKMDFFLTAWESSLFFRATETNKTEVQRSLGYNESGKQAFRDYLKERYSKIKTLNLKWHTDYPSFAAIEPPDDKHIKPAVKSSGLLFEFERWQRVNWTRYIASIRSALKEGAPNIPVEADPSVAVAEMNGYLLFKENGADIYCYHDNPSSEEALWTYYSTMRRTFGKEYGHQENYFMMYTASHMANERLAQRDIRKWFFDLLMRDIHYSTWWLSDYMSHKTEYIVAYGGGFFGLDYDQTIMRWCVTELAPLFARCRNIEKALLESSLEVPKTAIIQPCTTVFTLSALGMECRESTAIIEMLRAHYQLLLPGNYPHDYIPEEMALDDKANLSDYTLIVLPYAPYMTEEFSRRLMKWVKKGGNLIACGPFALMDEAGYDLPAEDSLFRTLFPGLRVAGPGAWELCADGSRRLPTMEVRTYGKGSLAYLNCSVDVAMRSASVKEPLMKFLAGAGELSAVSPAADLKILIREKSGGEKYLCLRNNNVEAPLETTVDAKGVYRQALDIVVPGWCPVPLEAKDGHTSVKVRLDPGDFTMILLKP